MTNGPSGPSPVLPALLLAALVLPFDPGWLDFEAARRGLLLAVLGACLLVRPAWFGAKGPGDGLLLAVAAWTGLAAIANTGSTVWSDAVLRVAWWLSLWATTRLAEAAGSGAVARTAPWLLVAAAIAGLLQRCGIEFAGGTSAEPVSLFGNRNVAAEFVAVTAGVVVAHFAARPRLHAIALALAGAYAIANGSRSALVALPVVGALAAVLPPRRGALGLAPLGALLAGAAAALLAVSALPRTGDPRAPRMPGAATGTATLEVRFEIQKSALAMFADAPLLGMGAGQFAVQYPRHRSQREIELSSLQRHEPRRVGTAHDDWIETAVEGGAPAFVLLVLFAVSRLCAASPRSRALPLVALFLLMLVRAPLGNAPAVAMALLATGSPEPAPRSVDRRGFGLRSLGLALLLLGGAVLASAFLLARYVDARGEAPTGDVAWLERAAALGPVDPAAFELLARERQIAARSAADVELALVAAEQALALRPHETSYQLLRADLLRSAARFREAKEQLAQVAAIDPGHPQIQLQLAAVYFTEGDVDGTLAALCTDPPPALRPQLAERLDEFAALADARGMAPARARFAAEAAFVRVVDALQKTGPLADALAKERFDRMREALAAAEWKDRDVRELMLLAIQAQRVGDAATATAAGELATKKALPLLAWHWSLLAPTAAALRALPAWSSLLPAR